MAMQPTSIVPPYMVEDRRPQQSERAIAKIVKTKMQMAETPEARKEPSEEESPAC